MKRMITLTLVVTFIFTLSGVFPVQAAQPMMQHSEQQNMMHEDKEASDMMENEDPQMGDVPSMLEQMSETLAQGNVTPDMLKQMSDQMKQMAQMMKQMPLMGNMMTQMSMMQQMPMMGMMPMIHQMMHGGKMMGHMPMMMKMMPMMHQMMHPEHEYEDADPKLTGMRLQMQGEMMRALGEIMMKYGKLMAEEISSEK